MSELNPENPEAEKLREEIRGLKLQRITAVLGILGAVGAFLFGNYDKITDLIWPQPKLQIVTEDEFLRNNGSVTIERLVDGAFQPLHKAPIAELRQWIRLPEGSYLIRAYLDDRVVSEVEAILRAGERRPVIMSPQGRGITAWPVHLEWRLRSPGGKFPATVATPAHSVGPELHSPCVDS